MSKSTPSLAQLFASLIIVIVLIVAAELLLYQPWRDLSSWSRLDPAKLSKLTVGMPQADVELLLGGPPGDYGNPQLKDSPGQETQEGYFPPLPPGSVQMVWSDDRNKFELFFDASGHLLTWHKRARFSRDYRPPAWRRKVREWIKL